MESNYFNKQLTVATFNCKGFEEVGPKHEFINMIVEQSDVVFIQEHWLYKSQICKMSVLGGGVGVTGNSAMDETIPRIGRPHGGCAILWSTSLIAKATPIECKHNRLCALLMNINEMQSLFINAYMPVDTRSRDTNYHEYVEVLNEIEQIILTYNADYVICGGDLNTDFSRTSPFTDTLRSFTNDYNLDVAIELVKFNIPYTYICDTTSSKIDHVLVSPIDCISECKIIDKLCSDHAVVYTKINIMMNHNVHVTDSIADRNEPQWSKASADDIKNYQDKLLFNLNNIVVDKSMMHCTDVNCTDHTDSLCSFYCEILDACIKADVDIPRSKKSTRNVRPGWDRYVADSHAEALWWHNRWVAEGRPTHGDSAELRRISRAAYHRQVKSINRDKKKIERNNMAMACIEGDRDLFEEIGRMRGKNRRSTPVLVDNESDPHKINEIFYNKTSQLYNSVPFDETEMHIISGKINSRIRNNQAMYYVNVQDVCKAVMHLKKKKSDGAEGLSSDHFINAPHILYVYLCIVYNIMLTHGVSPESMLLGTIIPIPKVKKQVVCNSDKFRTITLSSIAGKILDWVILFKEKEQLCSSDLQFGFKEKVSTTDCTFALKETIKYYNCNKSNVYVLLLDATKAFDRVRYCKLFKLLLQRNVNPLVLRLLLHMYTKQELQVWWGTVCSNVFNVCNGVKQGGVLSPVLFAVYMDELLVRLKRSGVGCHIGYSFLGALAYADDLTLLCPTLKSLRILVRICELFSDDYDVLFNGPKSKFLIFQGRDCTVNLDACITVNGNDVPRTNDADHLGHRISSESDDSLVEYATNNFW